MSLNPSPAPERARSHLVSAAGPIGGASDDTNGASGYGF